jgi:hypothetical protein
MALLLGLALEMATSASLIPDAAVCGSGDAGRDSPGVAAFADEEASATAVGNFGEPERVSSEGVSSSIRRNCISFAR